MCLFERDKGFEEFRPLAWTARYPPSRFCAVAYQVDSEEQMKRYLAYAVRNRIGNIFITDARGSNPYDRLPIYWEAEVTTVQKMNEGAEP